jgi:iron complex outermembrane receptor protein
VWRIDQENILKLQYAQAFRPPTFFELEYARSRGIEPSTIETFEAGYIFKRPTLQARLVLFLSNLSDPITFDELAPCGFSDTPDVRLEGIDAEYRQNLGPGLKLDADISYIDARFRSSGEKLPGAAAWLGCGS